MRNAAHRANVRKLIIMAVLVLLAAAAYMLVEVNFGSEKLFLYAMKIRTPKLIAMLITAFAIGGASIVFQSIINNTIVTPCLLGMNSLYTLIHTAVQRMASSRGRREIRKISSCSISPESSAAGVMSITPINMEMTARTKRASAKSKVRVRPLI